MKYWRRGTIFDLGILAANFWLVPRLAELARAEGPGSALFGILLLLSGPCYCLGAWLKRSPLRARLAGADPTPFGILVVLFILLVMQYGLFIGSFSFGWELLGGSGASGLFMAAALLLAALPPALTIRALLPPRENPQPAPGREALADGCLYAAAVVALAWWDGIFVDSLARDGGFSLAAVIPLTVLLAVPFAIFYLSPRVLLLAEDYRNPGTWLRIVAVMLPVSGRLLAR